MYRDNVIILNKKVCNEKLMKINVNINSINEKV